MSENTTDTTTGIPPKVTPPTAKPPVITPIKPVIRKPVMGAGAPAAAPIKPITPVTPAPSAAASDTAPTVRLRPVQPVAPKTEPARPSPTPTSSIHKTGIVAEGILTDIQIQAAKTKTSRISLESAMGVAPASESNAPLKTIRLKRPSEMGKSATSSMTGAISPAVAKTTSRIPDNALPTEPAVEVAQKKTLKIRRPGAPAPAPANAPASAEATPATDTFDESQLTPLSFDDMPVVAPRKAGPMTMVAVIVATAALLVMGALTWMLLASAMGPDAGPNSNAFISGPSLMGS